MIDPAYLKIIDRDVSTIRKRSDQRRVTRASTRLRGSCAALLKSDRSPLKIMYGSQKKIGIAELRRPVQ